MDDPILSDEEHQDRAIPPAYRLLSLATVQQTPDVIAGQSCRDRVVLVDPRGNDTFGQAGPANAPIFAEAKKGPKIAGVVVDRCPLARPADLLRGEELVYIGHFGRFQRDIPAASLFRKSAAA